MMNSTPSSTSRRKLEAHRERRRRQKLRKPLAEFIPSITPEFSNPTHLAPITKHLDEITKAIRKGDRERLRLAFSVPPQHRKTETILHWVAQLLGTDPKLRIAYASYNQLIAERKAMSAQRYATRVGVKADPRMASRADWRTTDGGGLIARGRGGGITGEPLDIAVVDDLFKDRKEADSPTIRQDAWDFLVDVIETRLSDDGALVLFFTRWHEDDVIGRVLDYRNDDFTTIRLPALADHHDAAGEKPAPDPLGRELGEPLLPEQRTREALEATRDNPATSQSFYSLYQGLPRSQKTRIFGPPTHYDPTELPKDGYRFAFGMDCAYTKRTAADNSTLVWGRSIGAGETTRYYIEGVLARQVEASEWLDTIKPIVGKHLVRWRGSGTEKGTESMFRRDKINLDFSTTSLDKLANNTPVAAAWNEGRVLLPSSPNDPRADDDWVHALARQCSRFTGLDDPDDDLVDALGNWHEALTGVTFNMPGPIGFG